MDDVLSTAPAQAESLTGSASRRSQRRSKKNGTTEAAAKPGRNSGQHGSRGGAGRGRRGGGLNPLARFEKALKSRIAECTLTSEDQACVDRCTSELQVLADKLGCEWSLKLFGSAANGFGSRESDIDATLIEDTSSLDEISGPQSAASVLKERLAPLIREHPNLTIAEEVLGASIPILKLRFEDKVDVDLSCRNTEALQNTRLLRGYADLDDRVRDLGVLVKLWAKSANVWGASRRCLSSYTFTLLAIYFMQVHPDVNLPYLPTGSFSDGATCDSAEKVAAARSIWACPLSIGELLGRFFAFYHFEFHWGREVVSTRLGRRLWATDTVFESLRGRWVTRLHVEDPYKLERNLNCVLGEVEERELRVAFAEACNALQMGAAPPGLGGTFLAEVSPMTSPMLMPNGDPDLLHMLCQEADLGEAAAWYEGHAGDYEEESGEATKGYTGAGAEAVFAALTGRNPAASASPGSSGASTSSGGAHGGAAGESSGTDSQTSDDERKVGKREQGPSGKWQWWQHLGELDLSARPDDAALAGEIAAADLRPAPRWHTIQDLEGKLGGGGRSDTGNRSVGVSEVIAASSFASRSSRGIAARVSSRLLAGLVAYQ